MGTPTDTRIMLFEPRMQGHHLNWLRYITEDFLSAGLSPILAVDGRPEALSRIRSHLADVLADVQIVSLFDDSGRLRGGRKLRALKACLEQSPAEAVFFNSFDEVASSCLRRAAVGFRPPTVLRGRINGVYFRPRFLYRSGSETSVGNLVKRFGFHRLCRGGWFGRLFLLDEYLLRSAAAPALFHWLPDPWEGDFSVSVDEARRALQIPQGARVFLHYGIGDRRKGLHLAARAVLASPVEDDWFLLSAGELSKDREIIQLLNLLESRGRGKVLNRFISKEEARLCLCASDVVLLPYIRHFGSSGILSLAAAAGKMVVASDEGLVGRRVADHGLGLVFASNSTDSLSAKMNEAVNLPQDDRERIRHAAAAYARGCSREMFRTALLKPFLETPQTGKGPPCTGAKPKP